MVLLVRLGSYYINVSCIDIYLHVPSGFSYIRVKGFKNWIIISQQMEIFIAYSLHINSQKFKNKMRQTYNVYKLCTDQMTNFIFIIFSIVENIL